MVSYIIQITREKVAKEDRINENSFEYQEISDFARYLCETTTDEVEKAVMNHLSTALKGVFKRCGRELTYMGAEKFIDEWRKRIVSDAMSLTNESFKENISAYYLEQVLEKTHVGSSLRICQYNDGTLPHSFGDFICYCYVHLTKGDKLYIGGIVPYKY